jgi:hypothetical protein
LTEFHDGSPRNPVLDVAIGTACVNEPATTPLYASGAAHESCRRVKCVRKRTKAPKASLKMCEKSR